MNKYTDEQKIGMIKAVDDLRAQGLTVGNACDQALVNRANYNYWKYDVPRLKKATSVKSKKVQMISLPVIQKPNLGNEDKIALFIGSSKTMSKVFNQIFGG